MWLPQCLAREAPASSSAPRFRSERASLSRGATARARASPKACRAAVCRSPPVDMHQQEGQLLEVLRVACLCCSVDRHALLQGISSPLDPDAVLLQGGRPRHTCESLHREGSIAQQPQIECLMGGVIAGPLVHWLPCQSQAVLLQLKLRCRTAWKVSCTTVMPICCHFARCLGAKGSIAPK